MVTHDELLDEACSFAVFPFLKTHSPVQVGRLTFRSTDEPSAPSPQQATWLREIADMLFLRDDLRIESAAYAVVPYVDLNDPQADFEYLRKVQSVVAYCYAMPRHEFGDVFLTSEHASMAVFSPGSVWKGLVRPEFGVVAALPLSELQEDEFGAVDGYVGLYNFRDHFWCVPGSRVYGPIPHPVLNRSQDLSSDLSWLAATRSDYRHLIALLDEPGDDLAARVFTTVRWFNSANNGANDEMASIVTLSIAFEALLRVPRDAKSDRLADAISLLLGRTPRLENWVRQFYNARSSIVHEGDVGQLRFIATDSPKQKNGPQYQSLLSYGRRVFQLCLGTLLVGARLAKDADLEATLITNQERFTAVCKILKDSTIPAGERLGRIAPLVSAIQQYEYAPESGLCIDTMLGAARLTAKVLLESGVSFTDDLIAALKDLVRVERSVDHLAELEALGVLNGLVSETLPPRELRGGEAAWDLIQAAWGYVFMRYYAIKKRQRDLTASTKAAEEGHTGSSASQDDPGSGET